MVKRITPILQARMGSSRLPGKVLRELCGSTALEHIVRRIRRVPGLEPMVIATTVCAADDAIANECERMGVLCYRGSERDVLSRFYEAALKHNAGHIMRICADNPLLEPELLSELAGFYRAHEYSYVRNENTPLGLGAEIFSFARLEQAHKHGKQPHHREHVTPFMYENNEDCGRLYMNPGYEDLRFTMDTSEDFAFVAAVYEKLYADNPEFGLDDILELLKSQPELMLINRGVAQRPATAYESGARTTYRPKK